MDAREHPAQSPTTSPSAPRQALGRALSGSPEATYSPNDTHPHGTCASDTSKELSPLLYPKAQMLNAGLLKPCKTVVGMLMSEKLGESSVVSGDCPWWVL